MQDLRKQGVFADILVDDSGSGFQELVREARKSDRCQNLVADAKKFELCPVSDGAD